MISKDDARAAFEGACAAPSKEESISWINSSSLVRRAYLLGIYFGLKEIAVERDLGSLALTIFRETMWLRGADDTFPSTRIGQAFLGVKKDLQETASPFSKDNLATLRKAIEENEHKIGVEFRNLASLMSDVQIRTSEMYGFLDALERSLRTIALFETDHRLSTRLVDQPTFPR